MSKIVVAIGSVYKNSVFAIVRHFLCGCSEFERGDFCFFLMYSHVIVGAVLYVLPKAYRPYCEK